MTRTLPYRCPTCNRKLAAAEGAQVATQVVTRTCRGCGDRWQIVIVPQVREISGTTAYFDTGTFTRLKTPCTIMKVGR